jgi:hypothetical protein
MEIIADQAETRSHETPHQEWKHSYKARLLDLSQFQGNQERQTIKLPQFKEYSTKSIPQIILLYIWIFLKFWHI